MTDFQQFSVFTVRDACDTYIIYSLQPTPVHIIYTLSHAPNIECAHTHTHCVIPTEKYRDPLGHPEMLPRDREQLMLPVVKRWITACPLKKGNVQVLGQHAGQVRLGTAGDNRRVEMTMARVYIKFCTQAFLLEIIYTDLYRKLLPSLCPSKPNV